MCKAKYKIQLFKDDHSFKLRFTGSVRKFQAMRSEWYKSLGNELWKMKGSLQELLYEWFFVWSFEQITRQRSKFSGTELCDSFHSRAMARMLPCWVKHEKQYDWFVWSFEQITRQCSKFSGTELCDSFYSRAVAWMLPCWVKHEKWICLKFWKNWQENTTRCLAHELCESFHTKNVAWMVLCLMNNGHVSCLPKLRASMSSISSCREWSCSSLHQS